MTIPTVPALTAVADGTPTAQQPGTATQTALSQPETARAYPHGIEPGNGRTA